MKMSKEKFILVFLCLICLFMVVGCSNDESNVNNNSNDADNSFNLEEVMSQGNYQIIDVRTEEEFLEEHVKSAINIPVSDINSIDISKNVVLLVYCRSGARSKQAYDILIDMGYTVYNLGGISDIDLEKE